MNVVWETDYRILSELILPDAQVPLDIGDYGKRYARLNEENEEHNYSVTIQSLPENSFVFNVDDSFPRSEKIFNNIKGVHKRSDFILLSEYSEKKYALFIEMKLGGNDKNLDIICQLKGSLSLFRYCQQIGRLFWEEDNFLDDYKFIFLVFKEIPIVSLKKKRTRIDHTKSLVDKEKINCSISCIPEDLCIIRYQSEVYFKKLFQDIQ